MPELPEVSAACALLSDVLAGQTIASVRIADDPIVVDGVPPEAVAERLLGAAVRSIGRRGKFFWFDLGERGIVCAHLGMNGAVLELTPGRVCGVEYVEATYRADDPKLEKYVKFDLTTAAGRRVVMADKRRFSRIWLAESPAADARLSALGPDAHDELPVAGDLAERLRRRKAPVKAVLLDQGFLSGIGNWIADEVLYQARIAPARSADSLSESECSALHEAIRDVVAHAVAVGADKDRFPEHWMFHHRWGGAKGTEFIDGQVIQRDTVGGRTTAWVPSIQK